MSDPVKATHIAAALLALVPKSLRDTNALRRYAWRILTTDNPAYKERGRS